MEIVVLQALFSFTILEFSWVQMVIVVMPILLLFFFLWGYWHCGHSWPIMPASDDSEDDCGKADGM
jgi:hypothetical protein